MHHEDFLAIVKLIDPNYSGIVEQPILTANGVNVGWHSTVQTQNNAALAGGTAKNRLAARRIAIAEFIERGLFLQLSKNPAYVKAFLIGEIPTTSGFAAGFDLDSTRFRSLCEGVERWAWSQWIDRQYEVPLQLVRPTLSPLAQALVNPFCEVKLFQRMIFVSPEVYDKHLMFSVLLGLTGNGVFAGSRVTTEIDDMWTHAAVEAWRNCNNFNLTMKSTTGAKGSDWLERRVLYFGERQTDALGQIERANRKDWPTPKLRLSLGIAPYQGIHLWRTLFKDFLPWHKGPDDRFVY